MSTTEEIAEQRKRNWAWIWLGYTGFLFIQPIMDPSRSLWLGTLAVFATFPRVNSCSQQFNRCQAWFYFTRPADWCLLLR